MRDATPCFACTAPKASRPSAVWAQTWASCPGSLQSAFWGRESNLWVEFADLFKLHFGIAANIYPEVRREWDMKLAVGLRR